jgi:predicted secreted Zn-dependent protease
MMLRPLSLAALLLGAAATAHAADIRERTKYFTIGGTTLEELDRDLGRKGPVMAGTGMRHPGATEVKFDGKVTYKPTKDGRCAVAKTDLTLHLVKTLPKWTAPKTATPTVALIWKTLSDDIARHEGDHARIARGYVKKMESAIRNLGAAPSCEAMEARVNAVSARYLAAHQAAQVEFDVIEGREMNMRLGRLLKRNVAAAEAQ